MATMEQMLYNYTRQSYKSSIFVMFRKLQAEKTKVWVATKDNMHAAIDSLIFGRRKVTWTGW